MRYRFVIDGVDRTGYLEPGVSFELNIDGGGSLSLVAKDKTGAWAPLVDEQIDVYDDSVSPSVKLFGGIVDQVSQVHIQTTSAIFCEVKCIDYSGYCERRIVGRYFNLLYGGTSQNIANALATDYLADFGITYDLYGSFSTVVGEVTFNFVPVNEALDILARLAGAHWVVDEDKLLRLFTTTANYYAAPANLTDALANYVSARVSYSRGRFANRVIVKNSRDLLAMYTETWYGNGVQTMFYTSVNLRSAPIVTVNSVEKIVLEMAIAMASPVPTYDWYWIQDGVGVIQNPLATPLSGGASPDRIDISYPSKLPYVAIAEDLASIAAVGYFEKVVEAKDVETKAALDDIAASHLEARNDGLAAVEIVTRVDGFKPGQMVTVALDAPAVSGDFLVESVSAREVDITHFEYTLRLSQKGRRDKDPARFFETLIQMSRQATPTPVEMIRFTLAGTVEGLTNPGLTTGVKQAIKIAQVGGVIREVNLHFQSVNGGASTTGDITVQVYKNGSTIFSGGGIVYSAGGSGVATRWNNMASTPVRVERGDVFTIEVIGADSAAKDGTLEVVIS